MDAIRDNNVLKFRVDYLSTIKQKDGGDDKQVSAIDTEEALLAPKRISQVTSYILKHFDSKTKRNEYYTLNGKREYGFNALFATQSIPMAIKYYEEFKAQQEALPESQRLKVGIIYSYAQNDEVKEYSDLDSESNEDTSTLPQSQREFLDSAIDDYNKMFKCNFDSSGEKFQNFYKDFSLKLKNKELDLAIVVNMFLTGFDATTLNTLFVDKNLHYHGLLQAYSRTNRILNSTKSFGNIVCFRDLRDETDAALALFSDENAKGIIFLRTLEEYLKGYTDDKGKKHKGYLELVKELQEKFPLDDFASATLSESEAKEFLSLFGSILKLRNILECFDDFSDSLNERDRQDYQSHYLDHYDRLKSKSKAEKESILDDVEFQLELIKQVEVNIDYILKLIGERETSGKIPDDIMKLIDSSPSLRSKKDLLLRFINSISWQSDFYAYIAEEQAKELEIIIKKHHLKPKETKDFLTLSFERGELRVWGTELSKILPSLPLFGKASENSEPKRQAVKEDLQAFFERFKEFAILRDDDEA